MPRKTKQVSAGAARRGQSVSVALGQTPEAVHACMITSPLEKQLLAEVDSSRTFARAPEALTPVSVYLENLSVEKVPFSFEAGQLEEARHSFSRVVPESTPL